MIHRQYCPDFPHFLICLLGSDQVVDCEDDRGQISHSLVSYLHCTPKSGVQSSCDPRRSEVGSTVQICKRFRRLETDNLCEVAAQIQPHQSNDNGLPWGEAFSQPCRKLSHSRWTILVTPKEIISTDNQCAGRAYFRRYNDQKETTAKTCTFRNWEDGLPRTWSIMIASKTKPKVDAYLVVVECSRYL